MRMVLKMIMMMVVVVGVGILIYDLKHLFIDIIWNGNSRTSF